MFNDTLLNGLFDELEKIAKVRERGPGERTGRTIGAALGGSAGAVPGAIIGGGLGTMSGISRAARKNPHLIEQIQRAQKRSRVPFLNRYNRRAADRAAEELVTKMRRGAKIRGIGGALLGGALGAAALGSITAPVGGDIGRAHD